MRAGGIDPRARVVVLRRCADNAGVDEGRAGRRDRGGEALDGTRGDRVAVDVDRLAVAGGERSGKALRQRDRIAGRQDRQDEIRGGDLFLARRNHAGGLGARAGLGAAAFERGQHFEAVGDEPLSHGSAHHAGRDDGDERLHVSCSDVDAAAGANLLGSDDVGKAPFPPPRVPRITRHALGNASHFRFARPASKRGRRPHRSRTRHCVEPPHGKDAKRGAPDEIERCEDCAEHLPGLCACRARRICPGARGGSAQGRDRPNQQLGEPGADARPRRGHLQADQPRARKCRHAGRGRDLAARHFRQRRSRRGRRRCRRHACLRPRRAGAHPAACFHGHRRPVLVRESGFAAENHQGHHRQ